jgi:peptidyl-prolyl cis-trans isomerase NIMA-interacting 1
VREIPASTRAALAPLALLALVSLAATGCSSSSPAPTEAASAAASAAPAPLNRPLTDGPLVGDGPRIDDAPRPVGSEASAPSADAPLTVVGAAHILVAYKGALGAAKTVSRTKAEARKRAEEAREKLLAHQGTFEELVAKYSDDDLSRPAGGKIGNFERNVFPPAFTEAAFGMAVGGISEVVETPRGFHVLLRTK